MAREVDERVVQMKMENGAFERAAQITINTLEKIKSALNFGRADKSLQDLDGAVKTTNLDRLAESVELVSGRFSTLGIMGVTALQNITNKAINAGEQLLKSLTIAPISQGFDEYELKMGSVQTIMASTGAPLEEINGYLEELNTYADRTIYSFSDMTSSIGKFTNAGVDLRSAVKAIQGISNAAAVSGSNAQQASHAMYNFAQALSSGSVKLIDWKSIELANMATVEFKQQLLDTALALGTVRREGDKYVTTTTDLNGKVSDAFTATTMFNDSLSHQWMTTDVLVETLGRYADETTDIGKKAFAAAQDVKTFSQLLDTMKEAVGSGWAQTFEYIIGDFNEAKELWTAVNNVADQFISNMSDARNVSLKFWHDNGGRTAALEGLSNIFKGLWSAIKPLTEAWSEMFPPITGERLVQLSEKLRDASRNFGLNESAAKALKAIFKLLLVPLKGLVELFKIAVKIGGKIVSVFANIGEAALSGFGGAITLVTDFIDRVKKSAFIEKLVSNISHAFKAFLTVVGNGTSTIGKFVAWFKELGFVKDVTGWFQELGDTVAKFIDKHLNGLYRWLSKISGMSMKEWFDVFSQAEKDVENFIQTVKNIPLVQDIIESVAGAFADAKQMFWDFVNAVNDFGWNPFDWFVEKFNELKTLRLSDIGQMLTDLGAKIKEYFESFKDMSIPEKVIKLFGDAINYLKNKFVEFIDLLSKAKDKVKEFWKYFRGEDENTVSDVNDGPEQVETLMDKLKKFGKSISDFVSSIDIKEQLKSAGNAIKKFAQTVWDALKQIDMSTVFIITFGAAIFFLIRSVTKAVSLAGGLFKSLTSLSGTLEEFLKGIMGKKSKTESIKELAWSLTALVGALILLSLINPSKLLQGAVAMLGAIGALAAITAILSKLKKAKIFEGAKEITTAMLLLSSGVLLLSIALKVLEKIPWDAALKGIGYIGLLATELVAAAIIISKKERQVIRGSIFLIAFAAAVKIMTKGLLDMAGADWDTIWKGLAAFGGIMVALSAVLASASGVTFRGGLGVLIIISSLYLVKGAIESLSKIEIPSDKVESTILKLVGVVGAIMALMMATGMAGKYAIRGAIAIAILFKTVDLIADAVYSVQEMFNGKIGKIDEVVMTLITVFAGFAALLGATHFAGRYAVRGAVAVAVLNLTLSLIADFIERIANLSGQQLNNADTMLRTIATLFGTLLALMTLFQKNVDIKPAVVLAATISILMYAMNKLSEMEWKNVISSGVAMGVALGTLAAVLDSASKIKDNKGIGVIITTMLALAETAGAIYILANLPWKEVISAGVSLGAAMLAFAYASKIAENNAKGVLTMAGVALIAVATVLPLALLADFDWEKIVAAAGSLSVTMIALAYATKIAEGGLSTIGVLIASAASALIASYAIAKLAEFDWKNIVASAGSLSVTMLALAVAAKIASGIQSFGGTIALIGLSVAMIALAKAIEILSKQDFWAVVGAITGLASAIIVLGAAATVLGMVSEFAILGAAVLAALAGAAWIGSEAMLNYAKALEIFANTLLKFSHTTRKEATNIGVSIATILTSFMDTMIEYFGGMVKAFIGAGGNIVKGFVGGIVGNLRDVSGSATLLGQSFFTTICKFFGIASPAWLLEWVGSMIDSGLVNGIVNNMGSVFDAGQMLGNVSMEGVYSGLDGMDDLGDYFSNNYLQSILSNSNEWFGAGNDMSQIFQMGSMEGLSDTSYLEQMLGTDYINQIMGNSDAWANAGFDMSEIFKGGAIEGFGDSTYLEQIFGEDYINQIMGNSDAWSGAGIDLSSLVKDGTITGLTDGSFINQYLGDNWIPQMESVDFFGAGENGGKAYARGLHSKRLDATKSATGLAESAIKPFRDTSKMGKAGADFADSAISSVSKEENTTKLERAGKKQSTGYVNAFKTTLLGVGGVAYSSGATGVIGATVAEVLDQAFGHNEPYVRGRATADAKAYIENVATKEEREAAREQGRKLAEATRDGMKRVEIKSVAEQKMDEFIQGLSSKEGEIVSAGLKLGTAAVNEFKIPLNTMANVGATAIRTFAGSMSANQGAATGTAKSISVATLNEFQNREGQYGTSGRNSAIGFSSSLANLGYLAVTAGSQVGGSALSGLNLEAMKSVNIGRSLGQSFVDAISSKDRPSYYAGAELSQNAISGAGSRSGGTYSIGQNLGQGLINGMSSKEREIYAIAASLARAAAEAMAAAAQVHSPSKVTEKIGENMGKGLEQGMAKGANNKATQTTVNNAAKDLANNIKKGFTQALLIASPSREAMKIGEFVGQGLAIGMLNTEGLVENDASKLANSSLIAMQEAMKNINNILASDEDMTPVITPVIDLTNAKNGLDEISSMFQNKGVISIDQFTLDNLSATAATMRPITMTDRIQSQKDNSNAVVKAIQDLGTQFEGLKQSIASMQVVLDKKTVVGEIAMPMDKQFNTMHTRIRRGN